MALPRESTFLPTIKCSICGLQVEISLMGEHVCKGSGSDMSAPADAHSMIDVPPIPKKFARQPPAVDTVTANQSFSKNGYLTPMSASNDPRGGPPLTPREPRTPYDRNQNNLQPQTPIRSGGYGGFGDGNPRGTPLRGDAPTASRWDNDTTEPQRYDARMPQEGSNHPGTSNGLRPFAQDQPPASPRAPRANGYGGFGASDRQDQGPMQGAPRPLNRSETFPMPAVAAENNFRRPSVPGNRPERSWTGGSGSGGRPPLSDASRQMPPPRAEPMRPHPGPHDQQPSVDVAAEFGIGNPYHTPSDSASSGYSDFSAHSHTTTQTSPARSQNRHPQSDGRKPGPQQHVTQLATSFSNDLRIETSSRGGLRTPSPLTESPFTTSPQESYGRGLPPSRSHQLPLQHSSPPRHQDYFPSSDTSRSLPDPARDWHNGPPASPGGFLPVRKGSRDPTLPRGTCKACNQPIIGKSISSADGRLTGKYHKACFVCHTCAEPFTSAEFYVLEDKPFCEQHYHSLNGSLCGSCGTGIEGQYLEDEATSKYHVGCFRCLDCGQSLSDGYFDVDGGSYCERDAWQRAQQAWDNGAAALPPQDNGTYAAPPSKLGPGRLAPPASGYGGGGAPPNAAAQRGWSRGGAPPASGPGGPRQRGQPMPKLNKRMTRMGMM